LIERTSSSISTYIYIDTNSCDKSEYDNDM
jgi:hypothetical protein